MDESVTEGAVLWFRPDLGEGAVQTDGGRFLRFVGQWLPFVPEVGRKVQVILRPAAPARGVVSVRPLPGGRREFAPVAEVAVRDALATPAFGPSRPPGIEPPRLIRVAPESGGASGRAVRRRRGGRTYPERKAGEAFAVGSSVRHSQFGQGFVVMSTTRVARVRFAGQERSVRVAECVALDETSK